jgi:hypothetical protein
MVNDFAARRKTSLDFRDHLVSRFILYPKHWQAFNDPNSFNWKRVRFDESELGKVPCNKRGVYTFVAEPDVASHPACHYLLYVGKVETSDFRVRFRSYLCEPTKRKPREHVLYMIDRWKPFLWFYYSVLPHGIVAGSVEDNLLTALLPPVNRAWPAKIREEMKLVFS